MSVPNTFATATSPIPLANLDANFAYYDAAFSIVSTALSFIANPTLSAGTANGVTYLNGSKMLTSGTALTFDGARLTVNGGATSEVLRLNATADTYVSFQRSGVGTAYVQSAAGAFYLWNQENTAILFGVNNTEQMRLTSTGLGIGTSSPSQKLDVTGKISTVVAGGGTHLLMGNSYATVSLGSAQNAGLDADMVFYTQTSTERMRLNSAGNLGIGTNSPAAPLDVFNSTSQDVIAVRYSTLGKVAGIYLDSGSVYYGGGAFNYTNAFEAGHQSNYAAIRTAGTERLRIASTGAGTATADWTFNGVTVGRGAGAVAGNTVVGANALYSNTTGSTNTAVGINSGYTNTSGAGNSFFGRASGYSNSTGSANSAFGQDALYNNTTASNNTAVGYQAGYSNVTGGFNAYFGYYSGFNATGYQNTFIGSASGYLITSGAKNTILGQYSGNQGGLDIRTASNYIVLSDGDGNPRGVFDGSGNFLVGTTSSSLMGGKSLKIDGGTDTTNNQYSFLAFHSNSTFYFGLNNNGYVQASAIYGRTTASAANVNVDASGYVTRSTSARKYKHDIRDIEEIDISLLRPVRYKSKCESDDQTKDHLGVIADEAADAGFEELVIRGADGEVEGFQYERLTVVLLKELQSLRARVAQLEAK